MVLSLLYSLILLYQGATAYGHHGLNLVRPSIDHISASAVINNKHTDATIFFPDKYLSRKSHAPTPSANRFVSASAIINDSKTVATIFYPDSLLAPEYYAPRPTAVALRSHAEWWEHVNQHPKHEASHHASNLVNSNMHLNLAAVGNREVHTRKPLTKKPIKSPAFLPEMKSIVFVDETYLSTADISPFSASSTSYHLVLITDPTSMMATTDDYNNRSQGNTADELSSPQDEQPSELESGNIFSPPSESSPASIIFPEESLVALGNVELEETAISDHYGKPNDDDKDTEDPAYPITEGESVTVTSSEIDRPQCTWDGVQVNDPVSLKPVAKYQYQSESKNIDGPTAGVDEDILSILRKMTLKEKIGQMTQIEVGQLVDCNGYLNETAVKYWINEWKVGSFLETPGNHNGRYRWYSPKLFADFTDAVQKIALANGPKIPVIWGLDSVRGANYVKGAVMFPAGIGSAATFNPQFAYDAGRVAAKDTRAAGVHWAFAPISDLGVNKLWSRTYENFGEDPYLSSQMTAASVRGYQGGYKHDRSRVAACIKHFIAYGYPFNGDDRGNRHIAPHELMEYYVPPFKAAIDSGVATAMESYGVINGEPVVTSHYYLTDLLRTQLGFKGMLVTDWGEINSQVSVYRTARDIRQATWATIDKTSVDMSMVADDASFGEAMLGLVSSGALQESRLDESVGRILQLKKDLGLFEQPLADRKLAETVGSAQDIKAARNAVRESVTLLKNNNGALPLKATEKVLFVGPTLNSTRFLGGGWNVHWQGPSSDEGDSVYESFGDTIISGIKEVTGAEPVYFSGTDIDGSEFFEMSEILAAARAADKVVIGLGEHTYAENLGNIGELLLPERQLELVDKIAAATDSPIAVVLVQGRPRRLGKIPGLVDAVVNAYLPGEYGGLPIAEILYGKVNPSGRLPYTYPATEAQASTTVWQPAYSEYNPQWAFGYGLGYSTFKYSNVTVSSNTLGTDSPIDVSVSITNYGPYPQKETVMLFTQQAYRFNLAPENNRLRKFAKVNIAVGQTKQVKFKLAADDMAFWNSNLKREIHGDVPVKLQINPYTQANLTSSISLVA